MIGVHALRLQHCPLAAYTGSQGVEVVGLVQRGHGLHGGIEQTDQVTERIAEEAGNAQGHVYTRAVEQAQRQDFEIVHALAASGPHRPHAHQRHGLSNVVAASAHGRRTPYRQAELAQVIAVVLQVAFEDQAGRGETQAPGRGGGQVAHHVEAPAAGCAAGAGGHEAPRQCRQQAIHFGSAAGVQAGCHRVTQGLKYVVHRLPFT